MTHRVSREREERGSSLIELMIGMVASVLVVGASLTMTVHQAKLQKADEELELAFVACQNNLEELRSLPFASLAAMNGIGFDVPGKHGAPRGLRPVDGDPDDLPGQFSVTVDQSSAGETLYLVKASVTWTGSQRRQSFELETLMEARQ